jgi:signal peptidase I
MYKPNKWIAGALGLILQWLAFLYVARPGWTAFYLITIWSIAISQFLVPHFLPGTPAVIFTIALGLSPFICAGHAFLMAANHKGIPERPWYSRWYGLISIFLGLFLAVVLFRIFFYEPFRIPSGAMLPTLKVGSQVVVAKSGFGIYHSHGITFLKTPPSKELHRGELIVFLYPEDESLTFIKRIIGLPGDTVEYKNKRLTINGTAVESRVVSESPVNEIVEEHLENHTFQVQHNKSRQSQNAVYTVPATYYFMMGDNRDDSRDSRVWGFLPAENIVGRVVYTLDPPEIE